MKYIHIFTQVTLLALLVTVVDAKTTCSDQVRQMELKKENIDSNRGIWGYFEKNHDLKNKSMEAMQLDSRINRILFLLNHLCDTQRGIPLTPLAIYLSKNIAKKGKSIFEAELLAIGKTSQQIDKWFEFCHYAESQIARTLVLAKIQTAINQSVPLILRYVKLADIISRGGPPEESLQKVEELTINIDQLLFNQPYLSKALEETSHIPYWDITEGDLG